MLWRHLSYFISSWNCKWALRFLNPFYNTQATFILHVLLKLLFRIFTDWLKFWILLKTFHWNFYKLLFSWQKQIQFSSNASNSLFWLLPCVTKSLVIIVLNLVFLHHYRWGVLFVVTSWIHSHLVLLTTYSSFFVILLLELKHPLSLSSSWNSQWALLWLGRRTCSMEESGKNLFLALS